MSYASQKHCAVTRPPRKSPFIEIEVITDVEQLQAVSHDAAHYPGGNTSVLIYPQDEAELARIVQQYQRILPIGAQSSLTGGATPMGEVVVSMARQTSILEVKRETVRVQVGLTLRALQEALAPHSSYYPPVPSYDGATVGGAIATNAAGPATFKYGSTRNWVQAITVVLTSGDVLDVERGQYFAHPDGYFEIESSKGLQRVLVPSYTVPHVPKCSAGYYAAPQMDLIDLFVGAEGTLGILTEATLRIVTPAPAVCMAVVPCETEEQALDITRKLRVHSLETRRTQDDRGLDISAIEYIDARSLSIVQEDGSDKRNGFHFQSSTHALLLIQIELTSEYVNRAYNDLAVALEADAPDVPLVRFVCLLEEAHVLEETELVMPGDQRRAEQVRALREAVPDGVNMRVLKSKREQNAAITKVAADMIVPFEHLVGMMHLFREGFEKRNLDYAIWGHISDGNMHPNLVPHAYEDIKAAQEVVLACGQAVTNLGGCPLAEHGVGRNLIKKQLLRQLYGETGYAQMHAVKQALDPQGKLAPGNLFPS